MLKLYFSGSGLPRNISKKEWKEIWRWKRITEKILQKQIDEQVNNFVCFGTTMSRHMKQDIMDKITNPPLLIYNKQG